MAFTLRRVPARTEAPGFTRRPLSTAPAAGGPSSVAGTQGRPVVYLGRTGLFSANTGRTVSSAVSLQSLPKAKYLNMRFGFLRGQTDRTAPALPVLSVSQGCLGIGGSKEGAAAGLHTALPLGKTPGEADPEAGPRASVDPPEPGEAKPCAHADPTRFRPPRPSRSSQVPSRRIEDHSPAAAIKQ
ncbi:hypothetical protein VULLAG_LOCUS19662 [Vulpes lagopus]